MSLGRIALALLVTWGAGCLQAGVVRADFLIQPAVHGSLVDVGHGMAGGLDLGLSLAWMPIQEVALGIDLGLMAPIQPGGANDSEAAAGTDLILQACPVVWLRFGRDEAWGFVRAGLGIASHLRDGVFDSVMIGVLAGGFVVAPRQLPFHFGFELAGEYELYDRPDTRAIGLGAFVGWVL